MLRYDAMSRVADELWMGTDLQWFYKDNRATTQGPFSGADMLRWYREGYMHERLLVMAIPAGSELSSCCASFKLLGEVFMQLHVLHVSAFFG